MATKLEDKSVEELEQILAELLGPKRWNRVVISPEKVNQKNQLLNFIYHLKTKDTWFSPDLLTWVEVGMGELALYSQELEDELKENKRNGARNLLLMRQYYENNK